MICVTDVTIEEVDRDVHKVVKREMRPVDAKITVSKTVQEIIVHGRRFITPNGRVVTIGWTDAVQKSLGLPFQAFEDMNNHIERLSADLGNTERELWKRNDRIRRINAMTFRERIRFLFSRNLPDPTLDGGDKK
ncbi:MAG: hypothetical protein ACYTEQ_00945 [Planctomycetota bacterium]|jgi:hypothetical protein